MIDLHRDACLRCAPGGYPATWPNFEVSSALNQGDFFYAMDYRHAQRIGTRGLKTWNINSAGKGQQAMVAERFMLCDSSDTAVCFRKIAGVESAAIAIARTHGLPCAEGACWE